MRQRRIPSVRSLWRHGPHPTWVPLMLVFFTALVIVHRGQILMSTPQVTGGREALEEASGVIFASDELEREMRAGEGALNPVTAPAEPLFLFVGILSGRGYRHRRLAVREAWATNSSTHGSVVSKFVLSQDERTPQVEKELAAYGDIIFISQRTNYKSILYKTYYILEYAVKHYDVKFILKTDDDAFVNIPPMLAELRVLCESTDCVNERLYMGRMARHSEVLLQQGHKWNNDAFYNHTGLKTYPTYAMGGGYVLGGEVARLMVELHERMSLKFTPIEDATLGFWLSALDLRQIDHPKFWTWAAPCCFRSPLRRAGRRIITRFTMEPKYERGLCSTEDPWIILHKIDSPTKMRFVGAKARNCTTQYDGLSWSLRTWMPERSREQWDKKFKTRLDEEEKWKLEHPDGERDPDEDIDHDQQQEEEKPNDDGGQAQDS